MTVGINGTKGTTDAVAQRSDGSSSGNNLGFAGNAFRRVVNILSSGKGGVELTVGVDFRGRVFSSSHVRGP